MPRFAPLHRSTQALESEGYSVERLLRRRPTLVKTELEPSLRGQVKAELIQRLGRPPLAGSTPNSRGRGDCWPGASGGGPSSQRHRRLSMPPSSDAPAVIQALEVVGGGPPGPSWGNRWRHARRRRTGGHSDKLTENQESEYSFRHGDGRLEMAGNCRQRRPKRAFVPGGRDGRSEKALGPTAGRARVGLRPFLDLPQSWPRSVAMFGI